MEFNKKRIAEEQSLLINLCKEFNQQGFAAEPIKTITDLMNYYIAGEDNEALPVMEIKGIVCQMTNLIAFIASLHENVALIEQLERITNKQN